MIKFICLEKEPLAFESNINLIQKNVSPFKEILKKNDYTSYSFVKDEDEANGFSFTNVFQLQVNVKGVGEFHILLNRENLDKDNLINGIASLKEIIVNDEESAKYKLSELFNLVKDYNPLFIISSLFKNSLINNESLLSLYQLDVPLFYVDEPKEAIEEKVIEPTSIEKEKTHTGFKHIGQVIVKNKYHLLLLLVASLLIESTIPLGILNVYSQNGLAVFLFICAVIGMAMNGYTYWDYFKKRGFKDPLFLLSIISDLIGFGGGIGGFVIFYNISTKPENDIGLGKYILIGGLACLGICLLTIVICYFLPKLINKLKKKEK